MSSRDRRPWLSATVLDQDFLEDCADNLTSQLELVVEVETPTGTIYASDRNKYVGEVFYEALLNFPVVERTLGEWLSNELEFASLTLELSNADGRFNAFAPGGASFGGWIGKEVTVKLGIRDVASTYRTIYQGKVTEVGGFKRTIQSIVLVVRDRFDDLKLSIPDTVFTKTDFPDLEDDKEGLGIPVVYGNWAVSLVSGTSVVPGTVTNGKSAMLSSSTQVQCRVSDNPIGIDSNSILLVRGQDSYPIPSGFITINSYGFNVTQVGITIEGSPYLYAQGDLFYCRCQGPSLGGYLTNPVAQAKDMLKTYGGLVDGDFSTEWATLRDKATPAQSAISTIKCRVWLQESQELMAYVASLLEQVRLEPYVDANLKMGLRSMHFEDFDAAPALTIRNWDVERGSFSPTIDERNNFNRAQGFYNFEPLLGEEVQKTRVYRNSGAITQAGRTISKQVVFPNLYEDTDVTNQLIEIIRLASAYSEMVELSATWRLLLLDLGDFVKLNVQIGSAQFSNVPCMVRYIGYDPQGIKVKLRLWSMQMSPFPGYSPGYTGTVGGYNALVTAE